MTSVHSSATLNHDIAGSLEPQCLVFQTMFEHTSRQVLSLLLLPGCEP